jgi:glycosyltransferase involved in cell wall biosynthesis/O-antigen/teichoic acid export membrane protein
MSAILETVENNDLAETFLPNETVSSTETVSTGLRTDVFSDSVIVLLLLAAIQRIVGFTRGVLVCRWLSPDELGQWDMAFGFLTLAAPLTVLGLPGSFGRYVEYFRQRGQLGLLLKRTAIACTILTVLSVAAICTATSFFSTIVFGRTGEFQLMLVLAVSLAVVIAFNYLTELLTALRMARKTAVIQFFNSLMFAGFSVLFLLAWRQQAIALVAAYGLACFLQIGSMIWYLRRQLRTIPAAPIAVANGESADFWPRLLSFAAWVWVGNLLYNLFDVADRYMIVHSSSAPDPLAVVGAYHSSRIVPLLLVSIATLLGTMLLPHLSHDWEAGRRSQVSDRMNLMLKLLGLLLFTGSIAILLAGPFLFNVAFKGKFHGGMEVLPWTLTYCSWFGLATMAQMYLWCAERARLSCLALFFGLITNVVLNLILLPRFGLLGAVWATAVANFTALALILRFNGWLGMKIERSLLLVAALPISLGLGLWAALGTLAAVACGIVRTDQIFSHDEKQRLLNVWNRYADRIPRLRIPSSQYESFMKNQSESYAESLDHLENQPSCNRPLRVMFCTTSMHIGGAETLLFNLIERLDKSRFAPELCCLKEPGELGQKLTQSIPVHSRLLKNKFDLRILPRLSELFRERQIDAVVTVGSGDKMFWGRLAARRAGVSVVISALHSTGWPDGITWLNRRLTKLTDAFVAVASRHAAHLVHTERLPSSKVHFIPNGIDTDVFRPQPQNGNLRKQLDIPLCAPLVGIVAVLRPEKNHEMFLRVAARVSQEVPEVHFLVIGDGPRRIELEALSVKLKLTDRVHFLGKRSDVSQLLALIDVFALTSHNEANPVSILEALSTAKPVVATRVGSVPETVLDGLTGYLVAPGGELAMSSRITELLLDPAKAQRLGAVGRRHVMEHWSLAHMVAGYENLLEALYRQKTMPTVTLREKSVVP